MKKCNLINLLSVLCLMAIMQGCSQEEDIYKRFPPEILFKRLTVDANGNENWEVSPDAKEITLDQGVSVWTVMARVSAPNELAEILLINASEGETVLNRYTDFTSNPNVINIEYEITGITMQTTVRIKAKDKPGNTTVREFVIKVL